LRLGVKTTGCSGLAYVLEFVDEVNADDSVFEDNGLKVIIDGKAWFIWMALILISLKKA